MNVIEAERETLTTEFSAPTVSRHLEGELSTDRVWWNESRHKFVPVSLSPTAVVDSQTSSAVSVYIQKGLAVLVGFALYLGCLWVFNRPY